MRALSRSLAAATFLAGLALLALPATAALSFTDVTLAAGTGGPTESGNTGGHGACWGDVDNDGLPDLYHTMILSQAMPDLFFRNKGDGTFANEGAARGIDDFDGGSHGCAFADLDSDGDYDLINGTTWDNSTYRNHNNIYRNNGSGFYSEVTPQLLRDRVGSSWETRAFIALDLDKDGDLDLFGVTNYQGSSDPSGERNEVYRNKGGLQFEAINSGDLFTAPAGQGAIDTDFDGDGDVDVIAANRSGNVNILRNNGSGSFSLVAPSSLGISHGAGDGISAGDIDNDGDLDLLFASDEVGHLYVNNGAAYSFKKTFNNTAGYMGGFADLDNDGDLDLYFAGDDVVYLNDGSGNFSAGPSVPVSGIGDPRGVAFADYDHDGDLDFAVGAKSSRNWLVRNNFDAGNWLKVKLVSPQGQAGAFGAKTRVYPAGQAGGQLLALRESRSNNGYLGQDDPVLHFGLGSRSTVDVVVTFLDGSTVTKSNVSANQTLVVDASGTGTTQIPLYGVFEASFTATGAYANPYKDASMTVTFTSPTGKNYSVGGFWDGGSDWKARFSPNETGTWTYATNSSDSGLNGKSGNFTVTSSSNRGGIMPMTGYPYHMQYQNGEPFYFFGDTQWWLTQNVSAENLNGGTVRHYIDVRASQGFNYVHANVGDNAVSGMWVGRAGEAINPAKFKEIDDLVRYLNAKGITFGFMLAWAQDWESFPGQAERLRYARYVANRYSAYNVVFIVSGEYDEVSIDYSGIGNEIRNSDPHKRMITIHATGSVEGFAEQPWMSFGDYKQTYDGLHSSMLSAMDHGKPVVNSEYAYYKRDQNGDGSVDKPNSATLEQIRNATWDIVMSGGYFVTGFGTTYFGGNRDPGPFNVDDPKNDDWEEDVQHVKTFFTDPEWWKLGSADSTVSGTGTKYVLREPGRQYLVYVRNGSGNLTLNLGTTQSKSYLVRRFDPRTGQFTTLEGYAGTGPLTLSVPDNQDWLYSVKAEEVLCSEGEQRSCYSGPPGTAGAGPCRAGTQTCSSGQWGSCSGEVLPAAETCGDGIDQDCDGQLDDGCPTDCSAADNIGACHGLGTKADGLCYWNPGSPGTGASCNLCTTETTCEKLSAIACSDDPCEKGCALVDGQCITLKLEISNLNVASGKSYQVIDAGFVNDTLAYIDRSFTLSGVPPTLSGATLVRTANDDKARTEQNFLAFTVNQSVTVSVAHDDRIVPRPAWLSSFTDTGANISVTGPFSLYSKAFAAGPVALGGNEGAGNSMYIVAIQPLSGAPPACTPSEESLAAGMCSDGLDNDCDEKTDEADEDCAPACVLAGDVNGDGVVNIFDLVLVVNGIGSADSALDLNADGVVNIFDLVLAAFDFGKTLADACP